jgi:hypothetical protein
MATDAGAQDNGAAEVRLAAPTLQYSRQLILGLILRYAMKAAGFSGEKVATTHHELIDELVAVELANILQATCLADVLEYPKLNFLSD